MDDFDAIRRVARACHTTSKEKGWNHEQVLFQAVLDALEYGTDLPGSVHSVLNRVAQHMSRGESAGVPVMEKLALIMSEVAEAVEVFRMSSKRALRDPVVGAGGKPEGFGSELADIVIRVFDLSESLGIDIGEEIRQKMAYNRTRPARHGGKNA